MSILDQALGKHLQWAGEQHAWKFTKSDKSNTISVMEKPPTHSPLDGINCIAVAVCAIVGLHSVFIGSA